MEDADRRLGCKLRRLNLSFLYVTAADSLRRTKGPQVMELMFRRVAVDAWSEQGLFNTKPAACILSCGLEVVGRKARGWLPSFFLSAHFMTPGGIC